jgi:hypothetical protein
MRPLPLSPRFIALGVVVAAGVVTVVALGYLAFLLALHPPLVWDVPMSPTVTADICTALGRGQGLSGA